MSSCCVQKPQYKYAERSLTLVHIHSYTCAHEALSLLHLRCLKLVSSSMNNGTIMSLAMDLVLNRMAKILLCISVSVSCRVCVYVP